MKTNDFRRINLSAVGVIVAGMSAAAIGAPYTLEQKNFFAVDWLMMTMPAESA